MNELLNELNAFRTNEGKSEFADWRKARHMPMLEAYRVAQLAALAEAEEEENLRAEMEDKAARRAAAQAEPQGDEAAPVAKLPTYKQTANHARSSLMKPVEFIKGFLDANPDLSRKAAVIELQKQGINFSTARTQYQRWFKSQKGA